MCIRDSLEAYHYLPNCKDIKTKDQFTKALNAMKELRAFFLDQNLGPDSWKHCGTGMRKFYESKNILMSICDLKNSSRNYDLKGEVGVMQHEFCYVEGTKWGDQKDISEYKPGLQK